MRSNPTDDFARTGLSHTLEQGQHTREVRETARYPYRVIMDRTIYPQWGGVGTEFSQSPLAHQVQQLAGRVVHLNSHGVSNPLPGDINLRRIKHSPQQRQTRVRTKALHELLRLYPATSAADHQAAYEVSALFDAYAGKKQQRQLAGMVAYADKRAETAANIQRKMKPRQHLQLSSGLT